MGAPSVFLFAQGSMDQRLWMEEAIRRTTFPFELLRPGLVAQVGRDYIPVLFSDLTRYQAADDGGSAHQHEHPHDHATGDEAHPITRMLDGRKRVLGLAWYSGKVEVERTCPKDLAMEVFLAEAAHMVDFFYMTPEQREKIYDIYHGGHAETHDHGWFEETGNNDYWSWVGESFMYGFTAAFSDVPYSGDNFHHPTTPSIARQIRLTLQPQDAYEAVRNPRSTIVHKTGSWHEKQIKDIHEVRYETKDGALSAGMRLCKTCRWK